MSTSLEFQGGYFVMAEISLEGEHLQADDTYISKTFPQGLKIPFDANGSIEELEFDIKQGTYAEIDLSFGAYSDSNIPSIVVNGLYTNPQGTTYPLLFEYISGDYFSIVAEDDSGQGKIVLDKDIPVQALIKFNPDNWFQVISDSRLANATITTINNTPTLLISESVNSGIFDDIVDRIDQDTEAVFSSF